MHRPAVKGYSSSGRRSWLDVVCRGLPWSTVLVPPHCLLLAAHDPKLRALCPCPCVTTGESGRSDLNTEVLGCFFILDATLVVS